MKTLFIFLLCVFFAIVISITVIIVLLFVFLKSAFGDQNQNDDIYENFNSDMNSQ